MLQSALPLPVISKQDDWNFDTLRVSEVKIANTILVLIGLIGLSLALSAPVANAQSGRRQKTPEPAAPVPTPTPEPTPPPKSEQKEPEIIILVGADRNRTYDYYPSTFYDAALQGCANVLRNSSAGVDVTGGDLPRGEAIKKAKSGTKTYVVVLELQSQTMTRSPTNTNYDDVELDYVVFAPGTGKVATSGRTYQNLNSKGPVSVGVPTVRGSGGLYREALLNRAGEEAGERILKALHLGGAPRTN